MAVSAAARQREPRALHPHLALSAAHALVDYAAEGHRHFHIAAVARDRLPALRALESGTRISEVRQAGRAHAVPAAESVPAHLDAAWLVGQLVSD
jgi:hypothetical protein